MEKEKNNNLELAKILNFCSDESIDIDLNAPKEYKGWRQEGTKSFLIE